MPCSSGLTCRRGGFRSRQAGRADGQTHPTYPTYPTYLTYVGGTPTGFFFLPLFFTAFFLAAFFFPAFFAIRLSFP